MKNHICQYCLAIISLFISTISFAQGPPITGDKPIMLSKGNFVIKILTEIRGNNDGNYQKAPLMVHYLPGTNVLLGIHLPFVHYNFNDNELEKGFVFGDIELLGKYQFYRKDNTGKTFRMVAKTLQTLPTGADLDLLGISTALYQSYVGIIAGYESIKYGISNELGYNLMPNGDADELRYKLGFGLPLLKPVYPVKQVNLYFEYQSSWFPEVNEYALMYAQGLQYAKGQWTWEASVQAPLAQNVGPDKARKYSLFLGTRYVF